MVVAVIAAPLIGCAVLNAGADLASSAEYRAAQTVGLGPVLCGAVALVADVRTLCDLDRVCGPAAALWVPVGACLGAHAGAAALNAPGLPAWSSAIVAGIVWWACRKENNPCKTH